MINRFLYYSRYQEKMRFIAAHSVTILLKKADMKFLTKIVKFYVSLVTILILRGATYSKFYEKTNDTTVKASTFHIYEDIRFYSF